MSCRVPIAALSALILLWLGGGGPANAAAPTDVGGQPAWVHDPGECERCEIGVERRHPGIDHGLDQRVAPAERLLDMATRNPARAIGAADRGEVAAGKLADLIVLDRDILECPEDDIPNINVLLTYLGGDRPSGIRL